MSEGGEGGESKENGEEKGREGTGREGDGRGIVCVDCVLYIFAQLELAMHAIVMYRAYPNVTREDGVESHLCHKENKDQCHGKISKMKRNIWSCHHAKDIVHRAVTRLSSQFPKQLINQSTTNDN